MQPSPYTGGPVPIDDRDCDATCHSGVMWSPIIGGALTATAFTFILFSLATALGFASLSPWKVDLDNGKAFAITGAIVIIVIQWIASGVGGYLTGRLRTGYIGAHTHEVFFRDTAHGFLSWALATVFGVLFLASMAGHMHHHATSKDGDHAATAHYVDRLFGTPQHNAVVTDQDRAEAERILAIESVTNKMAQEDKASLTSLVSARTGLSDAEAEQRVSDVVAQEKADADRMQKYTAVSSLFLAFSLLVGAFVASAASALGGMHRDVHYTNGKLYLD